MVFLTGIIIGFAIAAPVGPIGLLCINRSLTNGLKIGLLSGLGAAFADAVYGMIAGLGLTTISSFLLREQVYIRIIGGAFLIYLAIRILMSSITKGLKEKNYKITPLKSFTTTFILTLTNPMTILSFVAIFAGLGLGTVNRGHISALFLVAGIFSGSMLWWLLISSLASILRKKVLNNNLLKIINILSGIIILILGLLALKPLWNILMKIMCTKKLRRFVWLKSY